MHLPNAEHAIISPEKITEYLLNPAHPRASGKAAFFRRFGFSRQHADAFGAALLAHARIHPVATSRPARDGSGVNYALIGPLPTPDGRNPRICTVWFVGGNQKSPRLVTAYGA
jgi:hypothetical protein